MSAWFLDLRLRWKILLAPTFLMLVLIGVSAYAMHMLRTFQAGADALIASPVIQAEMITDFSTAVWAAHARLYRLTATAANETDQKKIETLAAQTAAKLTEVSEKLKAFDEVRTWTGKTAADLEKLRTASADYLKQANAAVNMADGQAGAALMFMTTAERSFAQIETLTEEMTEFSKIFRDNEIARANADLGKQKFWLTGIALIAVVIGGLGAFLVSMAIAIPIVKIADVIKRIARGDRNAAIPDTNRRDEIGIIAGAVHGFKESMTETERLRAAQTQAAQQIEVDRKATMIKLAGEFQAAVGEIVGAVAASATELEATADALMKTAKSNQEHSSACASSSEQASTNVQSFVTATEEIIVTIDEIAQQLAESSMVAGEAVMHAEKTDARVIELSKAASRIDQVVKLITAIAKQTNLLALNATIEAARAGQAGKGFAVVAHEVKALALQTATAAQDIQAQISAMQAVTQESVTAIRDIGATIRKMSEIATAITARVEQQDVAARQMTSNVHEAAQGTAQVVVNIMDVSRGATNTKVASTQVLAAAQTLSQESNRLKLTLDTFLSEISVA